MTFDTFVNAENNAAPNAASNAFGVKVSYGNEIRRAACAEPSYAALCEVVAKLFELGEPAKLTLKYQDEDGDKVTMSSDIELQEAIRLSKNAKKIIRLFVETNKVVKEEEMKPADPDVVEVEGPADHWRDLHPFGGRGGWGGRGGMWGGRGAWGGRGGGFHHGPLHHARFPPHHGPGPFPHPPFGGRGFHHGPYGPRGGFGCRGGFGAFGRFGGPCADPTAAPAPAPAAEDENVNAPAQDANANPAPAVAPEDVRFAPPPFHHPPPPPHHGPWGHGHGHWGAGAWGGEEMRKAMKERKQAMKEHRKAMKDHLDEMRAACQTKEDREAIKAFKEAMKEEWKDAWKEMKKAHKEEEKDEKKEKKDKHHGDKHGDKHDKHHGEKHHKGKHGEKWGARDDSGERLMARHVADVTIPDNSLLPADTPVTKTWKLKNVGTVAWPAESQLIFVSRHGDNLNGPERVPVAGPVEPGQEVDVSVPFITPAEPGRYVGYYRMATADGVKFGQRVWVSFLIPAAAANTTVATAPATPTAPTVMDL